ncbi:RNA-binding protein [Pikeienuella piscinae]|uniref:RNA-binding protein n=1 Tax=Pikeienuella piscinae TaxID=2748098 RepID=A0A7L5BWN3_9RHOB|nr:RNA-binding protein [Pikeienuella piscinae]QIE56810.1 RNA-binding protein [Pikeienuella piscinae]
MTRGGAAKEKDGPERRCIATGESGGTDRLIRFVLDPDGRLTPDLAARLPGRGVWLTAKRTLVAKAVKKRLFSRGFRQPVEAPADLADRLEALLVTRLVEALGIARKAGLAVTGFEKVRARLKKGRVGALLAASDGAEDGRGKLIAVVTAIEKAGGGAIPIVDALRSEELGLAFGRDSVIHAALDQGGATDRVIREARRLDGFRQPG